MGPAEAPSFPVEDATPSDAEVVPLDRQLPPADSRLLDVGKVLVAGATGGTGRAVVQQLAEQGIPVRALVRDGLRASSLLPGSDQGVEILQGSTYKFQVGGWNGLYLFIRYLGCLALVDGSWERLHGRISHCTAQCCIHPLLPPSDHLYASLHAISASQCPPLSAPLPPHHRPTHPQDVVRAMAGCTAVICATGPTDRFNPLGPFEVDFRGVENLAAAAAKAGVTKFVLVSSIGADDPLFPLNLFWGVLFWKKQGELALQRSGLDYTILRPGESVSQTAVGGTWMCACLRGAIKLAYPYLLGIW